MTQKEIIKNYLFDERLDIYKNAYSDGWILGGTIRSLETKHGFIGFRGDRDARQMYKDGLIHGKEATSGGKKKFVWYKYKYEWEPQVKKESINSLF